MYPIRIVLVSIVTVLALAAFQIEAAEACSPVPPDNVSAPSNEKAYDAGLSPEPPSLPYAALVSDESSGCASDSCGDLDSLRVDVQVSSDTTMLRVDIEGESTIYLQPYTGEPSGDWSLRMYGYGNDFDELTLEVRSINADGYVSQAVTIVAISDRDSGGCSTTGNSTTGAMVLIACLFLFLQIRRRRLKSR